MGGQGADKSKRFCSHSCAASTSNVGRFKPPKLCAGCMIPLTNRERKYCPNCIPNKIVNLAETPTESLSHKARKQKVFLEQNSKCNGCGITHWREHRISFELEHKDGDNTNNVRENLEVLCPNCHSQTPTWRGRNKRKKVTDEEMRQAILETTSLRNALKLLKMNVSGNNHKRIKRIAEEIDGGLGEIRTHDAELTFTKDLKGPALGHLGDESITIH